VEFLNLTQITNHIGSMLPQEDNLPFAELPKVKHEKGEVACSIKLVFDLSKKQMYFKFHSKNKTKQELYYFGTNRGASGQIFLVRALKDVKYLLGTTLSDLFLELQKQAMQASEIYKIMELLQEAGLYFQASKTREGFLAEDKWYEFHGEKVVFNRAKGSFIISEQEISIEKMIRDSQELNPREKIVVIVPSVIFADGSEILLNEHPDYHKLVLKSLNLEIDESNTVDLRTCHLCRQKVPQVASDTYLAKLSRSGINKIFTTTTVNAAKDIKKSGYDDTYAICQPCYSNLRRGESYIATTLSGRLAGENVFILPEGLQQPFETYEEFPKVKKAVDLVFDAKDWYDKTVLETEEQRFTGGYTINLVFYRTDGNSISIMDAIEDVPTLRLVEVMERFGIWKERMREQTKLGISLGKVYRIIPVRSNKKGEQLNIQRVLDVYKALLLKQLLSPRLLFQYAMEAIDNGLSQIQRQNRDIYRNLPYYAKGSEDFYVRDILMNHLALMQVVQETGELQTPIFKKDVKVMEQVFQNEKIEESIRRMEQFIQEQGFNREARGLFYLGALLHRVALAQYSKGHKSKPILKKINFQGMKPQDMQRLIADLMEKLIQYRRMTAFTDALMSKYFAYYGLIRDNSVAELNELQNVFFLLSGYSYMVGSKVPDANREEIKAQQSIMSEDEVEFQIEESNE
jgi:CRISPR-associated protein Csh1